MTRQRKEASKNDRLEDRSDEVIRFCIGILVILIVVVVVYSLRGFEGKTFWTGLVPTLKVAAMAILVVAASGVAGGFLGFLFGIPRKLQNQHDTETNSHQSYGANTNLEQISDWLTKILVGVGLTQITELPNLVLKFGALVQPALGGGDEGSVLGMSIALFALVDGFMISYLWTRFHLGRVLSEVEQVKIAKQSQKDADALEIVDRQLRGRLGIDQDALNNAVETASSSMRAHIYYKASNHQARNWHIDPKLMERSIPIFRALLDSQSGNQYHQNHGSLGIALKDKDPPDWGAALECLNTAISIRGDEEGFSEYEFNRAECMISMEQPQDMSDEAYKQAILEDLRTGNNDPETKVWIANSQVIQGWLAANGIQLPE